MSSPTTKEQLKDWCLRQLGFPVIQINVDDDQVDDRIDEALQYFQEFHYDGTERTYLKHQITSDDLTNKYISVSESVIGINRIFPWRNSSISSGMFDMRYQMRLHDLFDFTSTSFVNYAVTMQYLRTLDMLFSGEQSIRFNKHTDRLYIDWNWLEGVVAGDWIIIEAKVIVDPETYTDVYNDRTLKRLATAYIKRQWGNNMKKFGGMQLPGGVLMNGQQVFDEAVAEIKEIEDDIRLTFQEPPKFEIG